MADNKTSEKCLICGEFFYTSERRETVHFICDECQIERAVETITQICLNTRKKEAIAVAFELMTDRWVRMHGPEHPFLVAAVLLTAFKNRGYGTKLAKWSFEANLDEAKKRSMKIPVSPCGYWGCAGEAIGCGIFASLVLKATPMSNGERGAANAITAKVLEQISAYGGPRCSKRESLIAILVTSGYTEEHWNMPLTDFEGVECMFTDKNADCISDKCPFYPKPDENDN